MKKKVAHECDENKDEKLRGVEFLRGERIDVGIDVHKRTFSVTLWSEMRGGVVKRWSQPADTEALMRSLSGCKKRTNRVVYEAGPTGYSLVRTLRETGFQADVIAPSRTPKTTGQEAKSDRLDSRKLAMWSAKNLLKPVRVPTVEEEGDRQLFRARDDAVKKRRRIKQQIKSFLLYHGIAEPDGLKNWAIRAVAALRKMELAEALRFALNLLLDDLEHCNVQVKKAHAMLKKLMQEKRHKAKSEALQTVPGVGLIVATAILTELIAPERFDTAREVVAMMGLAPMVSRTGETTRQGSMMKCGNVRLRTMLIEAAWRWVAKDQWASQIYRRMVSNTGDSKKAIAAMARRLGIILWRISVTGEPYRPHDENETESTKTTVPAKTIKQGRKKKTIREKALPVSQQRLLPV